VALPARSRIPAANVAVYVVENDRELAGARPKERPLNARTAPTTEFWTASFKVKVELFTVAVLTSSSNVTVTAASVSMQLEPLDGDVELTLGGVVSGATPVVKAQVAGTCIAFPARSFTPVVTVAV